jgi:DNA-binding NarL/FixJ family response regulator
VIAVLIADDHAVATGREAVACACEHRPDVVLMDLSMPDLDGIEATRIVKQRCPGTHVVVVTAFSERDRILQALDAGAVGYLLKDAEPAEILSGIRAAARGEAPLAPKAASALLAARAERRAGPDLTEREREVLALVGEGLPNKLIARRLGIAEKTVKAHLTNVFRQIGVFDRTQAALWAQQHGLAGRPQS